VETLRVLTADDEPGMLLAVARVLGDYSVHIADVEGEVRFDVEGTASGEEALQWIKAQPPDIFLLDHKLPGMSGLEVLDEVVRTAPQTLTIMITAYASIETAVRATKLGAYDFLAKPFTPEELRGTVRKAAGRIVLAREAGRLAAEKRQVRFQFISVLGHELKAPLVAVEGYLRIMKERAAGDDPHAYERMVERCLARTGHMRKLIVDLLDMTRIESGQKERSLTEVDVRDVARMAVETLLGEATERGITVTLAADAPVPMTADRGELESILTNLLSNAVKYNRDGGRVDLRLGVRGGVVSIAVSDTGIGMTEEETKRLGDDFVRIRGPKTRHILGSGLGLSIVKKLAALYDGELTVQSTPDVGSTFTVTLPQHPAEAGEPAGGPS